MNVSSENLKRHLKAVAIARAAFENPQGLAEVQNYIENKFRSYGLTVKRQIFQYQGQEFKNLIAEISSSSSPCALRRGSSGLIIAAHFDAVAGTPGADDNASGVAAMLEAARILSQVKTVRPVKFIAFNLEECGMVGSKAFIKLMNPQWGQTRGSDPIGMISLEMVGYAAREKGSQQMPAVLKPFYPDTGNFLALVSDFHSAKFLKEAERAFKEVEGLPVHALKVPMKGWAFPHTRLSDHSPFWDAGIPALLVTDTSFFRNPHYHKATDTIPTLDLNFLARVTEGVIRLGSN